MTRWILLAALLLSLDSLAAQTVHLHIKANGDAAAMEAAKKGYDYWKAQGASRIKLDDEAASRSNDKRKQSLYFPETFSGYVLSPAHELLKVTNGRVVKRMKVRPLVDRVRARPEIDDEVLTDAGQDQRPVREKPEQ